MSLKVQATTASHYARYKHTASDCWLPGVSTEWFWIDVMDKKLKKQEEHREGRRCAHPLSPAQSVAKLTLALGCQSAPIQRTRLSLANARANMNSWKLHTTCFSLYFPLTGRSLKTRLVRTLPKNAHVPWKPEDCLKSSLAVFRTEIQLWYPTDTLQFTALHWLPLAQYGSLPYSWPRLSTGAFHWSSTTIRMVLTSEGGTRTLVWHFCAVYATFHSHLLLLLLALCTYSSRAEETITTLLWASTHPWGATGFQLIT